MEKRGVFLYGKKYNQIFYQVSCVAIIFLIVSYPGDRYVVGEYYVDDVRYISISCITIAEIIDPESYYMEKNNDLLSYLDTNYKNGDSSDWRKTEDGSLEISGRFYAYKNYAYAYLSIRVL